MEHFKMVRGARIIMRDWVKVHPGDKICLVTSVKHYGEVRLLQNAAEDLGGVVSILFVEQEGIHVGDYFDMNPQIFRPYDVIVGASDYSIITTRAAEIAVSSGKKMLSLPLSVNNGESMLGFDFITMTWMKQGCWLRQPWG